jgi:signal transduction histidine kinase
MLRNMKVGTKLFTVLAAPVIVLVVLAAIGVSQRVDDASDAGRIEQLTGFVGVNSDLIEALQVETVWSSAYMASGAGRFRPDLADARVVTDEALGAYQRSLADVDPGADSKAIADAVDGAESRLESLRTIRTSVDVQQSQPTVAVESLAAVYNDLVEVNAAIVPQATEASLLRGLTSVVNLERHKSAVATEAGLLVGASAQGFFPDRDGTPCDPADADCVSFVAARAASDEASQADQTFEEAATAEEKQRKRDADAGQRYDGFVQDTYRGAADGNDVDVDVRAFVDASAERLGKLKTVEDALIAGVIAMASDLSSDARRAATLYVAGALAAILAALLIAGVVARTLTGPLKKLTAAAYALSTDKLPALVDRLRNPDEGEEPLSATLTPIEIHSKDEVGQLADAFNSIQQVTVEVAEEQAQLLRKGIGDIFVNLARRNQSLLDRQIEFIDQLEANEEDPDQLDNLFKLDHLATRMRRNAESLLVLAGAEPPRRRGRPVSLADVVRVAIGEVEDFARIQLLALDEATVGGNVAVDLAHLLSELMENATHFSPPDTMVEIVGHRAGAEGYVLSVSDQGIGMSADQLAEANLQLTRPPLVGLALSRSLGFIVIGRLAQRFGIAVKLTASASGGVTALVTLPAKLVDYADGSPGTDVGVDTSAAATDVPLAATRVDAEEVFEVDLEPLAHDGARAPEPVADVAGDEEAFEELVADESSPPERAAADPAPLDDTPLRSSPYSSDDLFDELIDDVLPGSADLERDLRSLVSDELAPGPVEPPAPGTELSPDDSVPGAFGTPSVAPPPEDTPAAPPAEVPAPTTEPESVSAMAGSVPTTGTAEAAPLTAAGLVRRTPKKRTDAPPPGNVATSAQAMGQSQRSPEEVRKMLSRYRSGLNRGRVGADAEDT